MTAVDRDPVALAREVLDLTHEDETVTVCSVPDNKAAALARAVIAVAELADNLDAEADFLRDMGVHATVQGLYAHRIRAALSGETHD